MIPFFFFWLSIVWGKSEQMIEYIKKFRICIRWYMELEDGYLAEQGKLRNMLESEEKRHREIGKYPWWKKNNIFF